MGAITGSHVMIYSRDADAIAISCATSCSFRTWTPATAG